ncbi:MAG: flagellar biosynthesis protein FlhB [Paracoccaceae bacterium]
MAGQDDDTDKTFEPTPKKIADARKKGDVPKSQDLNTTAAYAGLFVAFYVLSLGSFGKDMTSLQALIAKPDDLAQVLFKGAGFLTFSELFSEVSSLLAVLFGLPALFVILSIIAQNSFTFAPTKLAPKLSRVSPISVAKQKFGASGLFEWFKSFIKLTVFSILLGLFLFIKLDEVTFAAALNSQQVLIVLADLFVQFFMIIIVITLLIGGIDFLFQKFDHNKKLMMSRKEVMDEAKESEGDPYLKQERQQRGRERLSNQVLKDVETADVIITNPTHYAIALHWSREPGSAPKCVAKGVDENARVIRERAMEFGVPIHEDPPTARALHATTDIGSEIPQDLYQAVATAIQFSEKMRMKARNRVY